jgi:Tol biopolymer transport system component
MKYDVRKKRLDLFKQKKPQSGPILPISLVILALIIILFSFITPSQFLPNINPANVRIPPPTPSATPLPFPTSINGGHIVFTCTRNNINQICLINADGSNYRQLTNEITNTYYPAISPDGKTVVYAINKSNNFDLYLINLSDSKVTQLTDNVGNSFSPDFSPDGKQILFVNRVGTGSSSLWLMGSMGENPHLLYSGLKDIVGAAWSPDGNSIAFAMEVDSPFTFEIFTLDLSDVNVQPRRISHGLTGIGGSIDWSPDGKKLLIFAGPVAAREIYSIEITTGKITQLTFGGNNAAASYSPDGQYIVYNSLRNNNQADLYIMRSDGHSTRQLTSFPDPDWQPKWGP